MIKPIAMCRWEFDKEKKETVKTVLGYLPGEFDNNGLLIRVLPNNFAQPAATPELAMKLVDQPSASKPIATVEF